MAAFLTTVAVLNIGCMFAMMLSSCAWAVDADLKFHNYVSVSTASITTEELAEPVSTSVSGEDAPGPVQIPVPGGCKPSDISFHQYQGSGVGLPRFNVHIANTCVHHNCVIRNIIAKCGPFHSFVVFVNPNVFRRLDYNQGTCLVNNGQPMKSGDSIDFAYCEVRMEPISFFSAEVSCDH